MSNNIKDLLYKIAIAIFCVGCYIAKLIWWIIKVIKKILNKMEGKRKNEY